MKKLVIEHNHGVYELKDAELIRTTPPRMFVRGTVTGGGVTNRLFWATSFTPEPVGEVREYGIWREPRCVNKENDEWYVSNVLC